MLDGVLSNSLKYEGTAKYYDKSCVKFVFPATWNRLPFPVLTIYFLTVCLLSVSTGCKEQEVSLLRAWKKGCWWVWTKIRTTSWKTIKHSVKHLWSLHLSLGLNFTSEETPCMFSASHLLNSYRIYILLSSSVCTALNRVPCWLF